MLRGLEKAEVRRNTLLRGFGRIPLLGVLWPDTVSVPPYTVMVSIAHQLIPNKLCWVLTSDGLNGVLCSKPKTPFFVPSPRLGLPPRGMEAKSPAKPEERSNAEDAKRLSIASTHLFAGMSTVVG